MYQVESYVGPSDDMSAHEYLEAVEVDAKLRLQDLKSAKSVHDSLRDIRNEYLDTLHAIVGNQSIGAYHEFRKKSQDNLREARQQYSSISEGSLKLKEIRERIRQETMSVFGQLGVNIDDIASLRKEYHEKARGVFRKPTKKKDIAPASPPANNQTYRPPYSGWYWAWSWEQEPASLPNPSFFHHLDHLVGEIGNYENIRVNDSGESDSTHMMYRTAVRIRGHRMSSTGQLNVRINLEKIDDSYHRWVGDERGYSNVDLTQIVDVYARTTSPAPVVGVEDYEEVRFDYDAHIGYKDQHSWSGDWNLGRTFHLRIPEVFRQGTRVDVEVGIKNYNYFWADDVSVNMSQILRYLVREVGLSSTGD